MNFQSTRCDPDEEECPPTCQDPRSPVEWTTLFNYLEISNQIRLEADDDPSLYSLNLIDKPQRDSAASVPQETTDDGWTDGNANLGRDIHWTVAHGRIRRDADPVSWNDDESVHFYCSNLLVNSTVALECGNYLMPSLILKAIQICVEDVGRNEDPAWAQDSLGLLEDQCEVEATYRRASEWRRDLLGRPAISPAIVEALNCPNRCSHQGVCLPYGCVCQPGFHASDCSLMDGMKT